jgi:hypothetical protein
MITKFLIHLKSNYIFVILLCLIPVLSSAQDTYEGQVINKVTEFAIPDVTVSLLKETVITKTNNQGYYNLSSESRILNDTLQFTSVGYKTFKLPVSAYQKQMFVSLEPSNTQLNEVEITSSKIRTITLGKFFYADLKTVIHKGNNNITVPIFAQTAIAKHFVSPEITAIIKSVQIGRRDLDEGIQPHTTANKYTRFIMSIMSSSANKGIPGEIIFTKTVSLSDNSLLIKIDLSQENIILPTTDFFITIQWLIIPYNEIINVTYDSKLDGVTKKGRELYTEVSKYSIYYQPFLVGYDSLKPAIRFTKNNGIWHKSSSYPKYELALSATISY